MGKLYCGKCGALKTGSYIKETYCAKCTGEKRKARREKRRKDLDLPLFGTGRDPKCKKCRTVKEVPYLNGSLCRKCKLEKAKVDYNKKARAEGIPLRNKGRNPLCSKCNVIKQNINDQYCNYCRALMKRERYARKKLDPEFMRMEREKSIAKLQNDYARLKKNCREKTHRLIKSGKLIKMNCEICNDMEVEAHHDDYTNPYEVRWLCKKHHSQHHTNLMEI